MITFADLGPVPTVHLFLRVQVPLLQGGWKWGEHAKAAGCLAREYAYSARECRALVMAYGRMVPKVFGQRALGERFGIMAKGPVTGMVLGLAEWRWSPAERDFTPCGEYLCGFRPAARTYYGKTGELIERQKFIASIFGTALGSGSMGQAA